MTDNWKDIHGQGLEELIWVQCIQSIVIYRLQIPMAFFTETGKNQS